MAHFFGDGIPSIPFKAGADLSGKQFYAVRASASVLDEVLAANGASNPHILGVLQNSPSIVGSEAEVKTLGFTKAVCRVATCDLRMSKLLVAASDGAFEVPATQTGSLVAARYHGANVTSGSVVAQVFLFGNSFAAGAAS